MYVPTYAWREVIENGVTLFKLCISFVFSYTHLSILIFTWSCECGGHDTLIKF
jgi:hypothetical protein